MLGTGKGVLDLSDRLDRIVFGWFWRARVRAALKLEQQARALEEESERLFSNCLILTRDDWKSFHDREEKARELRKEAAQQLADVPRQHRQHFFKELEG